MSNAYVRAYNYAIVLSMLLVCGVNALDLGQARAWGNATYCPMSVGETIDYLGRKVTLVSLNHNYCTIRVGQEERELIVARRNLPVVMGGVRVFVSDSSNVANITKDSRPHVHSALAGKDAVLCLSDPAKPLLDPEHFSFPISRRDGWEWPNESNSHMFAYLGPTRSHEGIDFDIHEGRGREVHAILALEDGIVRQLTSDGGNYEREARVLIESASHPGVYYRYSHVNDDTLRIQEGQRVTKGQMLGYIWGDNYWGHLHLAVTGWGDDASGLQGLMNVFPQIYELYYGSLGHPRRIWTKSSSWRYVDGNREDIDYWVFYCDTFHNDSIKYGNRVHREGYNDVVGYGWNLGTWCTAYKMDTVDIYQDSNVRLSKTLFAGTAAEAVNPNDYYDFEIDVENGYYDVRARVGDRDAASWQQVLFEGVDAGTFSQAAGAFVWTPKQTVAVRDGKLTIRLALKDASTLAGLRMLSFAKIHGLE